MSSTIEEQKRLIPREVSFDEVINDHRVQAYVEASDAVLEAIGFTEHGPRHAKVTGKVARHILSEFGFNHRMPELAAIAGYLHDAGNVINRHEHAHSGALMALQVLADMGMNPREIATVVSAIGHHDESDGYPVNAASAAVILADKTDVHRSRVRVTDPKLFDIHDQVNYSVTRSVLQVDGVRRIITLELDIDTTVASVMEFFEIFTDRMIMSRKAVEFLGGHFRLVANQVELHGGNHRS
ncbi:MAG: HD domain-containing protein [Acidobacteria bacterium]|nr:HD domain-containing protein [Acidobacteriota bacterium]